MSSTRRERLDPDRVGERAAVERPQLGDAAHEVHERRAGARRRRRTTTTSLVDRVVERGEVGRRDEVERATAPARRARPPASPRDDRALGGSTTWNSLPTFSRPLAIEITTLPGERVGVLARWWRPRRLPRRRDHDQVGRVARLGVVAGTSVRRDRPTRSRSVSTTASRPGGSSRDPHSTSWPTLASRAASPLPAGPVAPRHSDPHRRELATTRAGGSEPAGRRAAPGASRVSGDAVGAEEDAQLGEEAVAGSTK